MGLALAAEKDESGVKVDDCTGTVKRAHSGLQLGEEEAARLLITWANPAGPGRQPAITEAYRGAVGMESRLQPKTGRLQLLRLEWTWALPAEQELM